VLVVLAAGALTVGVAGQANAAKQPITVCPSGCDYTTIQAAIDNAPNGAQIQIAAGTYAAFSVPNTNAYQRSRSEPKRALMRLWLTPSSRSSVRTDTPS
jgi:hypothetical protein